MTALPDLRIDKWLWAARFYKTRGAASDAVKSGSVQLNNERVKPAHAIKPGDELRIRRGHEQMIVIVQALNERRRPAHEAQQLYTETQESAEQRELVSEQRRAMSSAMPVFDHRPNKRERRQLRQLTGKD